MRQEVTDDNAGMVDCRHTSGGVFVAIDSNLGAVVDREEGTVTFKAKSPKRG